MSKGKKKEKMPDQKTDNQDAENVVSNSNQPDSVYVPESVDQENVTKLEEQLEELKLKADEYLDGWQRSRAEFANYKKRIEREQAQIYQNASGDVLKRFLDVIDDLERAIKNQPTEGDFADWVAGIALVYRKLLKILEQEGVTVMDVAGNQFDPNQHEAISYEENEGMSEGHIIEVVKQGYRLGDRVLRPAVVRVAKDPN